MRQLYGSKESVDRIKRISECCANTPKSTIELADAIYSHKTTARRYIRHMVENGALQLAYVEGDAPFYKLVRPYIPNGNDDNLKRRLDIELAKPVFRDYMQSWFFGEPTIS